MGEVITHLIYMIIKMSLQLCKKRNPDAIIHCAGIVDKTEKARLNVVFTDNLLRAIREAGLSLQKIIICGSASEYGVVDSESPISEEHTRQPSW